MFELFRELNWSLIALLIVGGGIVAWVGDNVGMRLGKKRVKIFNMRPKRTATFITVCTGIGIALVSLLLVSISSEQVRTALFSMNYVQSQITALTAELQQNRDDLTMMEIELMQNRGELDKKQNELQAIEAELEEGAKQLAEAEKKLAEMKNLVEKARKERTALVSENSKLRKEGKELETSVKSLRKESEELRANLQRMREGRIAILTGEVLAQGIITDESLTPDKVDYAAKRLAEQSRSMVAYRLDKRPDSIPLPEIDEASVKETKAKLKKEGGRYLIRLIAASNAVEGETVRAEMETFKTKLVFRSGAELARKEFAGDTAPEAVEDGILRMLKEVNNHAFSAGVMRDPISGDVGAIDTNEFMDAVERISDSGNATVVKIVAAEDIYTEGPVRVKFEFEDKGK